MPVTTRRLGRLLGAATLAALTTLAACSPPADTSSSAAPASPAAPASTAPASTSTAPASAAPANAAAPSPAPGTNATPASGPTPVDALARTGPVDVPDIADMQPVVTGATPHLPATVTDSRGTKVTVTRADRVIALDLYGTLTDTVIGLGLADRLVGRGVSDTQASLKHLPVVSLGGIDLNVEAVLSLKPDLVLTNMTIGSKPLYDQIEAAGVTVVRFPQVPTIAEIPDAIHQVGAVFGMTDAADTLAAHTEARLTEVRAEIARLKSATPTPPRTIVVYIRGSAGIFFILGADYGAADLLRELGLDDVAAKAGITGLTPANAESLVQLDPQMVLTMRGGAKTAGGVDGLLARPGMSATAAGQARRVITAADSQLLSYGPRTPDNLLALARAIYTDAA